MSNPRIAYEMANARPVLLPLDGKPLLVHVVVNVECWQFDAPMPRALMTTPHGVTAVPDVPNYSWVEYGMRCGLPRILRALDERGLPASASLNAAVIEAYPPAAQAIRAAGWEFIGHGVLQRSLQSEQDEQAVIVEALDRIEEFVGTRPRGWLGPGLQQTPETPEILKSEGIEYVFDWVLDDLPVWMTTAKGPLLALPYSLELNDSLLHAVEHYRSDELYRRVVDTLAVFEVELPEQPRVLTLPLHPHLVGVPHRMRHFERTLDLLLAREDVRFVIGGEIADWYNEAVPPSEL